MRGADEQPGSMFSYVSLEDRVPAGPPVARDSPNHRPRARAPLAAVRQRVCEVRPAVDSAGEAVARAAAPGAVYDSQRAPVDRAYRLQPADFRRSSGRSHLLAVRSVEPRDTPLPPRRARLSATSGPSDSAPDAAARPSRSATSATRRVARRPHGSARRRADVHIEAVGRFAFGIPPQHALDRGSQPARNQALPQRRPKTGSSTNSLQAAFASAVPCWARPSGGLRVTWIPSPKGRPAVFVQLSANRASWLGAVCSSRNTPNISDCSAGSCGRVSTNRPWMATLSRCG